MKPVRKIVFAVFVFVLAFGLVACGDNGYADATNAALAGYNTSSQAAVDQLSKLNDDNSLISDQGWKDATLSALDQFETAGKAFASLPPAPDQYKETDSMLKDLSFAIKTYVDTGRRLVNNEDLNEIDSLNQQLDAINQLITKIDDSLAAANQ